MKADAGTTRAPNVLQQGDTLRDSAVRRVGCVSFLNAKPLIDGLEDGDNPAVKFDVPSHLLADLEGGRVDVALCPVIDYFTSATPLVIVPVGGIGCDGTTLTVRLYSQIPLDEITHVHADTDSHTSVALLRILLAERHGIRPTLIDYHARQHVADGRPVDWPEAMLLIGDKVVTDSPPAVRYPHQLDLGFAWKDLTKLPFVFAVWMARRGESLGDLPRVLNATRKRNEARIDAIVDRHAPKHAWPRDLARQYLGKWLKYAITPRQIEAIERFGTMCAQHGVIAARRDIEEYDKINDQ